MHGLDGTQAVAGADRRAPKTPEQQTVVEASIIGDRETLKADSFIPLTMAIIYLLLFFYFKSIGGYRAVHIEGTPGGRH